MKPISNKNYEILTEYCSSLTNHRPRLYQEDINTTYVYLDLSDFMYSPRVYNFDVMYCVLDDKPYLQIDLDS